ncbi:MAG TPA: PDZ domain-containing protein [Gemmatimonadales bacterium]|nr:PDZ domain-containing protein [Gemmatimonadales bacterium]
MNSLIALLIAGLAPAHSHPILKPQIQYTLRVDSTDLSGWTVEMRLRATSDPIRLAMAAHPEYDDRYWRYVRDVSVEPVGSVTRVDSAVWQVSAPAGFITVRYRIALPPSEPGLRASWRPYLTSTGGLIGGPHAFMYLLGGEHMMVSVALELPASWDIATGLDTTPDRHVFFAENAAALVDSPILVGRFHAWRFVDGGAAHRVVYWPMPDASSFDSVRFVAGIRAVVHQVIALFGGTPYRNYTFIYEDGAYSGGLEHRNSVTLGANSADLARDPNAVIPETAHEFFHTWNLMAIRPIEYHDIDYRTQPPVASLWFSEGLTMYYADLLQRRAGIPVRDSTRSAHLTRLVGTYLANPAYTRFSAESISRVAYNVDPGELGDYSASTHLQGELIGTMLDLIIRDATQGRRSMDDVMRLLFSRLDKLPPPPSRRTPSPYRVDGRIIEQAVESVCGCDVTPFFDAHVRGAQAIDFDRYLALAGLRTQVSSGPALSNGERERDLRLWGFERDSTVRLVINNPASSWGKAGLHSRDRLVSMNGMPVKTWSDLRATLQATRIGDTVRVEVARASGPFVATVVVAGFERPIVRLERLPNATLAQRRLAEEATF